MPPYTELPRPLGTLYFPYNPMSPPNCGMAPANTHIFVYPDVQTAVLALTQAATTIQAQVLEKVQKQGGKTPPLFSDHIYYRGQSEVTHRLIPNRLRGPKREPTTRQRFRVDAPPAVMFNGVAFPSRVFDAGGQDPKNHWGDWYENVEPMRSVENDLTPLSDEELRRRDKLERAYIERASGIPEIASLDHFQKRAAVKHYSSTPSSLLDVTTNPEVAAFFATGGGTTPPVAGKIGMLWAIDLNFFAGLFSLSITNIPGGIQIRMREQRERWGDNAKMFEQYGISSTCLDLSFVTLPFQRPQNQYARFFCLSGEDGAPLPPLTELAWWSIIERRAYACAFMQDGHTYENPSRNITAKALWPEHEDLALMLKPEPCLQA